jgi:hypothetical protein
LDGSLPKMSPAVRPFDQDGRQAKNRKKGEEFKKIPSNDYLIKMLFLLSKWCQAILEEGPLQNHFSKVWLRLAQLFQRRIFFKFHPPFF